MKNDITKFDLETAFKALDQLEYPEVSGVIANRLSKKELKESVTKMDHSDALFEDFFNINSEEGLEDAKDNRDAEIAKAKLARIEKIVDLDANSEEELEPSYVGKVVVQCPQCMTLFYKKPEDIEKSEEDPSVVNVEEVCQHCGNDSGYTLIGKIDAASEEDISTSEEELESTEEADTEKEEEDASETEETVEEEESAESEEDLKLNLDFLDEEPEKETERTEESLDTEITKSNIKLTEAANLDISDAEFKELMNSSEFKTPVSRQEIEKYLTDDLKTDNLTEAVDPQNNYNDFCDVLDIDSQQGKVQYIDLNNDNGFLYFFTNKLSKKDFKNWITKLFNDAIKDSYKQNIIDKEKYKEILENIKNLAETFKTGTIRLFVVKAIKDANENIKDFAYSYDRKAFTDYKDQLTKKLKLKTNDTDTEEDSTDTEQEKEYVFEGFDKLEDIEQEEVLEKCITESLTKIYDNVETFKLSTCRVDVQNKKLIIEGKINFKFGKSRNTKYIFDKATTAKFPTQVTFTGLNEELNKNGMFKLHTILEDGGRLLLPESFEFKYNINNILIEGLSKR